MTTQTTTIEVKLQPFLVPNFATVDLNPRHTGDKRETTLPLSELDSAAVNALAQQWLDDFYKKAGRRCPFLATEPA
jgi:hypothetical protein